MKVLIPIVAFIALLVLLELILVAYYKTREHLTGVKIPSEKRLDGSSLFMVLVIAMIIFYIIGGLYVKLTGVQ